MEKETAEKGTISEGAILSSAGIKFEKDETSQDGIMSEEGDTSEEEREEILRGGDVPFRYGEMYYSALYGKYGKTKDGLFGILGIKRASLKRLRIKVHVNGSVAEVSIEQDYFNQRRQSLRDACFFYSIGNECELIAAKAYMAGKTIEGDITTEIPAEFSDIVSDMKAKLSRQDDSFQGRTLYKVTIPRIRPKSEAVFIIKYVTEAGLVQENGSTHLRIPTTLVADRYAPHPSLVTEEVVKGGGGSYKNVPMEIEVTGLTKGKIRHLSSTSNLIDSLHEDSADGTITMTTALPGTDPTEIEEDFIVSFDWMKSKTVKEQSIVMHLSGPKGMVSNSATSHPLQKVSIQANVMSFIAEISIKLEYVNHGVEPINLKSHHLPIEQGAAVIECTATIGGELIETEIKHDLTAKQDIQETETSALLLEELNADTLDISINKLRPNIEAIVTIKYLIELPMIGSFAQLNIPATISPVVPLNVEVATTMQHGVKSVSSSTHEIVSEKQSSSSTGSSIMKASSLENETKTDNDFIVKIEREDHEGPITLMEKSQDRRRDDTVVYVSFIPSFELEKAPKEIIFMADRSSQQEKSFKRYHRAASFVIDLIVSDGWLRRIRGPQLAISKNCYFNVVRFGKFSSAVFPNGSKAYSRATEEKAIGIIGSDIVDMGQKDLLGALEHVLQQRPRNGLPRQIVLFIYGNVIDEEPILDLVRQHAHDTTFFCCGTGNEVSRPFLRAIARAGGGTSHFSVELELDQLQKDAFLPKLEELRISWEGSISRALSGSDLFDDMETLADISPSYEGNRLLLYRKFPASRVPAQVRVTLESSEGSSSDLVLLPRDKVIHLSGNQLHCLVARKLMRKLEKQQCVGDEVKERIIKLAMEYKLVSKFTTFVGKL